MVTKKVCPYCKRSFTTQKNARRYCTKKCSKRVAQKKQKIIAGKKYHLCQWCAKKFRPLEYRTKFCSCICRNSFADALMVLQRKTKRKPLKHSTREIVARSREAGVSYGVYVGINRLD